MNWLKRNDLAVFLFLTFAFSWWVWPFHFQNPQSTPMIPWGPFFAVFIVLGLTRGWSGVKSLLADIFRLRVGVRWYVLAFLLPIGITFTAVYLNVALGSSAPPTSIYAPTELILLIPGLVFTTLIAGPFTEEVGWRGFFLPRLQSKYSPLVASLIIGVIWWSWHTPLMVSDPTGQRPPLPFLASILAFSILYTWIYNRTGGSVFMVTLIHGVTNTIAGLLIRSQFGEYYIQMWWLYAAFWWVAALSVLLTSSFLARTTEPSLLERGQKSIEMT